MIDPQMPTPGPEDTAAHVPEAAEQTTLTYQPHSPASSVNPVSPSSKTESDRKLETLEFDSDAGSRPPVDLAASASTASLSANRPSPGDERSQQPHPQFREVAGYEILQVLGRGAMGVVYKARQRNLRRLVALKMVLAGEHASRQDMVRFHTEAMAAAELRHPNIVQVYELGEHNGLPFLSLEYVDGGSLKEMLKGRLPLEPKPAALLTQILVHAMDHAHRHNIIHRDLKPANVLLAVSDEQGETIQRTVTGSPVSFNFKGIHWIPKIADFGLAKRLEAHSDEQTHTGTVLGTAVYMPPEQAEGRSKEVGPLGDQYALGVMLYEFLTGRPPFQGSSIWETLELVRKQEPLPPSRLQPKLPRDLEIICLKCLQKDPQKRYATTAALAEDLRRFLAGEPIKARPVSNMERFARWCQRNPRVAALTGVVFLLLLSAAIGGLAFAYVLNLEKNQKEQARQLAVDNQRIAEENAIAAEKARAAADEQGGLALSTLGKLATGVQTKLEDSPGTNDLRAEILQSIAEDIAKVATTSEKAGVVKRTSAAARFQMGSVLSDQKKFTEAREEYKLAYQTLRELAENEPQSDKNRGNLALVLTSLGDMALQLEGPEAAREYYDQGLALRKEIVEHPRVKDLDPVDARRSLANSYDKLAMIETLPQQRESYARQAMNLRKSVDSKNPKDSASRADLASSSLMVGNALLEQGKLQEARPLLIEGIQLREQLVKDRPHSVNAKHNLALGLESLGDTYLLAREPGPAKEDYGKALQNYQDLHLSDAGNVHHMDDLARAYYRVATAELYLGDLQASQEHYGDALKLRETLAQKSSGNVFVLEALMIAQARCGQFEKASQIAKKIQNHPSFGKQSYHLFQVACCYALCADVATKSKAASTSTAEALTRADSYAERAIGALKDAVARGYSSLFSIETDPDLEPIRHTAKFDAALREWKKSLAQRSSESVKQQ
jgi:serine/threonine protein kinase